MTHPNQDLIDQFFAAYAARDLERLRTILAEDATWTFPGHHLLSGTHIGVEAIVAFFDAMGTALGPAQPTVERLVTGIGEQHVVECQQIRTSRPSAPNLDQPLAVLWTFAAGKIAAGQHLVADQDALDAFFAALA
jgi:hypothetical protein